MYEQNCVFLKCRKSRIIAETDNAVLKLKDEPSTGPDGVTGNLNHNKFLMHHFYLKNIINVILLKRVENLKP